MERHTIISKKEAKIKGLKRFFTGEPCPRGHVNERYVGGSSPCISCALENGKVQYKKNKVNRSSQIKQYYQDNKAAHLARTLESKRNRTVEKILHQSAKDRSARKGIEFSITVEDVIVPKYCPVLGIELKVSKCRGGLDNSPSLDRVDSSKGYILGNVVVMSDRANTIKNNGTAEEHEKIAKFMKEWK